MSTMIFTRFSLAVAGLVGMVGAAPMPHNGMVNNEFIQDVGAVYTEAQTGGDRTFLLAVKADPTCISLHVSVASVQICIPASCTLYTANDCVEGDDDWSFTVEGPGNNHTVSVPDSDYASYLCSISDLPEDTDTTALDNNKDQATPM